MNIFGPVSYIKKHNLIIFIISGDVTMDIVYLRRTLYIFLVVCVCEFYTLISNYSRASVLFCTCITHRLRIDDWVFIKN